MLASVGTNCTLTADLGKFMVDVWPHLLVGGGKKHEGGRNFKASVLHVVF